MWKERIPSDPLFAYADDLAMASGNLQELQEAVNTLDDTLGHWGMAISIHKTTVQVIQPSAATSVEQSGRDTCVKNPSFYMLRLI